MSAPKVFLKNPQISMSCDKQERHFLLQSNLCKYCSTPGFQYQTQVKHQAHLVMQATDVWRRELYDTLLQSSLDAVDALNLSYRQAPMPEDQVGHHAVHPALQAVLFWLRHPHRMGQVRGL